MKRAAQANQAAMGPAHWIWPGAAENRPEVQLPLSKNRATQILVSINLRLGGHGGPLSTAAPLAPSP